MAIQGAGGEEWRSMEKGGEYAPVASDIAASKQAIRDLRMREVELRLLDRYGRAIANTNVEVEQLQHAFPFGDQLWSLDRLHRDGQWDTDRARYLRKAMEDVLSAVNALCYWTERPRNDGPKSEDIQGEPRYEHFAACVDWARSKGLQVKGHPMFWSIQKCVPEWVKRYDYETQMKFVEVRIRTLAARFGGQVTMWDVVNEALWEPAFKNLPDRHWPHLESAGDIADYIEPVIRWARDEDPDALYVVNDYGLEGGGFKRPPIAKDGTEVTAELQRRRMLELMKELARRGAQPGAIGLQSHTAGFADKDVQVALYDEMAESGLPVQITEFWPPKVARQDMPDDEKDAMTAQYVCDYLTNAFGHPAVEAFFFWGMTGWGMRWKDDTSGHEFKPVYEAVKDLIRHQWWTRESLTTDGDGVVRFDAFYGPHTLRYPLPGGSNDGIRFDVDRHAAMPLTLVSTCAAAAT